MKVFSLGLAICAALAVTTASVDAKGTICNTGSGFADTGDSYNSDKPTVPVSSSTGSDGTTQTEASSSTAGSDITEVAGSSSTAGSDVTQQTDSSSTTGDDATQVAGSNSTQQTSSAGSSTTEVAASSSTTGSDATQVAASSSTYSDDTLVTSSSGSDATASQNDDDPTTQGSDGTTTAPTKGSADGTTSAGSDESGVGGSASSNNGAASSKGNTGSNSKGSSDNTVQDGSAPAANQSSQTGQQDSSVGGSKANAGQSSDVDSNTSSQASSPTVFSSSGSSVDSTPTQSSTSSAFTDSTPTQSSTAASASSSNSTPIQSSKSGSSDNSTPVQQTSTTASGSSDSSTPVQQASASTSGSSAGSSPVQQASASGSSDTSSPVQQTSASGSDSSTPIQQTSISASGSSGSPQTSTSASGSSAPTQGSTSASSGSISSSTSTSASAASSSASASTSSSSSSSSFTKVTRLGVRVQGDKPEWNAEHQRFVSAYYETFDEKYRAVLDTVNMASVEGALKYVQAECINASVITDCERKNNIKYVVFYQTTTVQPTAAMDYYVNATDEHNFAVESCPFMPMDGGRCNPNEDGSFPDVCNQYIGAGGQPELGFCVGGTLQDNEAIAPYPHNYWFSFPNSCPQELWDDKTDSCRSKYAGGMCELGQEPDGVTCSFTYEILGYILLDDVVGITSMTNPATGKKYADYSEFCKAGGVEFSVSIVTGVLSLLTNVLSTVVDLVEGIEFWANPGDSDANAERVEKLVSAYDALVSTNATTSDGGLMRALPTISELSALNPPCYENSPLCAESEFGCKRSYRSQICQVCTSDDSGCEKQ